MEKVRLGKTNLRVSRIGMGGIPLTRPSFEEAVKVVERALELGVNFFDTSLFYKDSELRIGKAIEKQREKVILATKGSWRSKDSTKDCIEKSLERLNTDYIDLWQFHNVSNEEKWRQMIAEGSLEAAQEALDSGMIKHLGISCHSLEIAVKAVKSELFETIQYPFNYIQNEAVGELVFLAEEFDVGFIAMKPFAGGMLDNAELAIKFILQYDHVIPDPGIEKIEEIEEIVRILNGSRGLTENDLLRIEEARSSIGTQFCRQCEYCMPCPQEVMICGLMYIPRLYDLWPPEWFVNWGYVTDAVSSHPNCLDCGECEEKCPYELPIRTIMRRNAEFYWEMADKHKDLLKTNIPYHAINKKN
jgi:predicted aldo/keto reductase-like oxidoreductase